MSKERKQYDVYEVPSGRGYVMARTNDGIGFFAVPHGDKVLPPDMELVAENVPVSPFHGDTCLETVGLPVSSFTLPSGVNELCAVDE